MKKYDLACAAVVVLYAALAAVTYLLLGGAQDRRDGQYLVEVNMAMKELESLDAYRKPEPAGYTRIKAVSFLKAGDMDNAEKLRDFFHTANGLDSCVRPLMKGGTLQGLVRFDYAGPSGMKEQLYVT